MRKPRRNHLPKFKAQIALEATRGEKTIAEIAASFGSGVTTSVSSTERKSLARSKASRRSVLIRSAGLRGIRDGAMTEVA